MKILINYANKIFAHNQKINTKTAWLVGGFDKIIQYSPKDIDQEFYVKYKHILEQARGGGYWLWKPYVIQKALNAANDGDFVFYCDSGSFFLSSIDPLINLSLIEKQDIICFSVGGDALESLYTKRDAFILMNCDTLNYINSLQIMGGYSLWRKSDVSMKFVDEWLKYASDERILTDIENECGEKNYEGFRDHRHDQSIFSLLSKKYKLTPHRAPYCGEDLKNFPHSTYSQFLCATRLTQKTNSLFNKIIGKFLSLKLQQAIYKSLYMKPFRFIYRLLLKPFR